MKDLLKRFAGTTLLAAAMLASSAPAQAQSPTKKAEKINKKRNKALKEGSTYTKEQLKYDSEFAVAAASTNMLEVSLGKLAQQKAIVQEVKDWGKKMEQEHTEAEQKLEAITVKNSIALPTMMSTEDRAIYDDVDDRKYLGFDKKYLRDLKELHERTVKRYAEAATKLTNPELLAYVTEMLPKLRAHESETAILFERANALK
jgi:putative membrane protein